MGVNYYWSSPTFHRYRYPSRIFIFSDTHSIAPSKFTHWYMYHNTIVNRSITSDLDLHFNITGSNTEFLFLDDIIIHLSKISISQNTWWCITVRGHSKMSTFSWVYKQYTFSDPLPSKCTDQHFRYPKYGFMYNIYCATTKINPSLKPVLYVTSDRFD